MFQTSLICGDTGDIRSIRIYRLLNTMFYALCVHFNLKPKTYQNQNDFFDD